jgi:hypothetical protein
VQRHFIGVWAARNGVAIMLLAALLVQSQAGFALRGLYADGSFFTTQIVASKSFYVFQPARWVSSIILEAPVVAAMMLGEMQPDKLATVFSLSANLLPGLGFLLCLAVTPRAERRYLIFPAFVYFAGTLSAAFASVTEGLLSTAYLWVLLFLIVFGENTLPRLTAILVLSVGTLRLHEEMLFLGPVLAAALLLRARSSRRSMDRGILAVAALAVLGGAAIGLWGVLFPRYAAGPSDFTVDFVRLHWLYIPHAGVNLPAAFGILAALGILAAIAAPRFGPATLIVFAATVSALAIAAFWIDGLTVPAAQFFARDNAAFMSFVLMIVVLIARRCPAIANRVTAPPVQGIVMALGFTVSLWHVSATAKWDAFQTNLARRLTIETGVIPWSQMVTPPASRQAQLAAMMVWPWTNPDLSLLVLSRSCITSLIANPPISGWQPYDLANPGTLPALPGVTYAYLLPPDAQGAACAKAVLPK